MIEIHTDAQGIATLTINLPGRALNVIDWAFSEALAAQLEQLAADASVTGVIITSGKSSFMAGADLSIMKDFVREGVSPRQAADLIGTIGRTLRRLETLGKPVVGASPGTALGGGLELLLACHHRVAAADPKARYGLPEVSLGLLPGAGGTQRLPRLIGIAKALPLLVEGRLLSTEEAQALGLIHEVVPVDALLETARRALLDGRVNPSAAWDRKGFRMPGGDSGVPALNELFSATNGRNFARTRGLLPAPRAIASCVYEGSRLPIDRALRIEQMYFAQLVQGSAAQGQIHTLFFARQAAEKRAGRPEELPPRPVSHLGVIGAGARGQAISRIAALAGISVVMVDRDAAQAAMARDTLVQGMALDMAQGRLDAAQGARAVERIEAGAGLSALGDCELVIEAIPEDPILKAGLLRQAQGAMAEGTVLASSSACLPIAGLASGCPRPAELLRLNVCMPGLAGSAAALVEVACGPDTSRVTLARAMDFVRQLRLLPLRVQDVPGFYTTRCLAAYWREGFQLLSQGADPVEIDNAALSAGMAIGPLALADDVGLAFVARLQRAMGGAALRGVDALVAAQREGRHAQAGVYDYPQGVRQRWGGLDALVGAAGGGATLAAADRPSQAAMAERLLTAQMLTAAEAHLQGVVADASEADLGAVIGWGFPKHLGGPLWAMDQEGLPAFVARLQRLAEQHGQHLAPSPRLLARAADGSGFIQG